jgi:hypothetical protein
VKNSGPQLDTVTLSKVEGDALDGNGESVILLGEDPRSVLRGEVEECGVRAAGPDLVVATRLANDLVGVMDEVGELGICHDLIVSGHTLGRAPQFGETA